MKPVLPFLHNCKINVISNEENGPIESQIWNYLRFIQGRETDHDLHIVTMDIPHLDPSNKNIYVLITVLKSHLTCKRFSPLLPELI